MFHVKHSLAWSVSHSEIDERICEEARGVLLAPLASFHQNLSFCRDLIDHVRDLSKYASSKMNNLSMKE